MSLESVIDKLGSIVGASNVLTGIEDLYVYSFQGPLGARIGLQPDLVVRTRSQEEGEKVKELANSIGFSVISRDEVVTPEVKRPIIMLDSTPRMDISSLKSRLRKEKRPLLTANEKSMNWLVGFRDILSDTVLSKECKDCVLSSGAACSGFCEVSPFFEGVETWSSKGRRLLTKGLLSGQLEPTKKLIDVIFTCTTCGQCYDACTVEEKKEIDRAIISARQEIIKRGLVPEVFKDVPTRIFEQGSPLQMPSRLSVRTGWFKRLDEMPKLEGSEILYWSGCMTAYRFPEIAVATTNLMRKANVDFMSMGEEEGCCGNTLFTSGLWEDAKKNATNVIKKLQETNAKTLVTGCAACYYTFSRVYPEVFHTEMPLTVIHTTQFIEQLIKNGKLKLQELKKKVTYHDPCDLGRHCGVYEPPRNVIRSIPGIELVDMSLNRSHERCCGGGGGLLIFNPYLSMGLAEKALTEEIIPLKVDAFITACPVCYMNFKYTGRRKKVDMEFYDLSEFVDKVAYSG